MQDSIPYAVIGAGVQANLGVSIHTGLSRIDIYSPRKGVKTVQILPTNLILDPFNQLEYLKISKILTI